MADSATTVFATIQKAFLLCAGIPADTILAPQVAQQVAADGNWTALAAAINGYLGPQASSVGAATLVARIAHQGLGIDLDPAQAASIAAPVVAGTASWADLVLAAANNTDAVYATTLANRAQAAQAFTDALTAQGKGDLYGNLPLQGAAQHLLEGVTANTGSVAMASESLVALVTALSHAGLGQVATDGYLSGTTVFIDANNNGRLDAGEYSATADIGGNVDLPPEAGSGTLVVTGGTDLLTGAPFQGYMSAPAGATVITPLTTIMQALLGGGSAGSATEAAAMVSAALGLPGGINLLNYDPLAVLADPGASDADKAIALSVEAKAIQVMDLIAHTMAGLGEAFGLDPAAASQLVQSSIDDAFASGEPVDLTDAATLAGIMEDAAAAHVGRDLTPTEQASIGQVADVTAAANSAAEAADSLFALAKVAHVAQEDLVNAIGDAITDGTLDALVDSFTGSGLQAAISDATVGSLEPGVPLDGNAGGVPEAAPTLTAIGVLSGGVEAHTFIITYNKLAAAANEADVNGDVIAFRVETITSGTLAEWNGSAWVPATPGTTLLEPGESLRWTPSGHTTGAAVPAFTVKAWDGMLNSDTAVQVKVHVEVGNKAPVITSGTTASYAENSTEAAYTVTSTDADTGDTATYSISGGADAALFGIDTSTGAVAFLSSPNFESPQDSGGDNVYDIVVKVTDSGNKSAILPVAITVTDANDAPAVTSAVSAGFDENATGTVYTIASSDEDPADTATYSISGGADAALFDVDASTGAVTFKSSPDFEDPQDSGGDNVYDIVVKVTDSGDLSATRSVAITVADVNEAPGITSSGSAGFDENDTGAAYTATSSDPDAADTASYSISGGADAALFDIDASTGDVTFKASPNFESPQDSGTDNVYDIVVKVTDSGSLSGTLPVAITVADVNEAPEVTSSGSVGFDENATGSVYTVTSSDPDTKDTATYSISGGVDASLFDIVASTGEVTFKSAPNFESPGDSGGDNVYDIVVKVTDSGSLSGTLPVAITVADVNEAPSVSSDATASFAENGAGTAYAVTSTDPDAGDTASYSISGGADAALFDIVATTGVVSFKSSPNFESPQDNGADNTYDIVVKVTDSGALSATQPVAISVTDVNEAPSITSGATANFAENGTGTAYTVTASDPDAKDTKTYSISGTDVALFDVDASTGAVTFKSAPNFEDAQDAGKDNVYDITVKVTDSGSLFATQAVKITVTDVNDAPKITSGASATFAENATGTVYTVKSTDEDVGDKATYSLSGTDSTLFSVDSSTGVVTFKSAPNFEGAKDAGSDNTYDIVVEVKDSKGLTDTKAVAITVTDVNEAPTLTSSTTANFAENGTGTAYAITASDPDAKDTKTYSMSGADVGLFNIDTSTGLVTFKSTPNFESAQDSGADNVYDITVKVTDSGSLFATQAVKITVTDVNEAPSITNVSGTANFAENGTGAAYTVTSTDPDAKDKASYSLSGTDATLFNIDSSTGAVTFKSAPNFESAKDSGGDNTYNIDVTVTDSGNLFDTKAVAITVTDVNETPVITSLGTASFKENATGTVYTITATDPDAKDTKTYSISGTDAAYFDVDTSSGVVTFKNPPDYENAQDAGKNNTYDIIVEVTDSGAIKATLPVAISVTDVNEAPTITNVSGTANFAENGTGAAYTVTSSDPDAKDTKTYSLSGTDSGLFNINTSTGAVTFKSAPDFENAKDSGTDNTYNFTVTVTDSGSLTDSKAVAITVTDVNESPSITSLGTASFAENATGTVYTITSSDPDAKDTASYSITGTDASFFDVDPSTGVVTFKSSPNFESAQDKGGDNVYDITVQVTDSGKLNATLPVAITVTDVNEAPSLTSGTSASFTENATGTVYTATATDPDAKDTKTYSISGTDSTYFNINPSTGAVTFKSSPDFETPLDSGADNTYDIDVTVKDSGNLTSTKSVTIKVTGVNETPAITSATTASVPENSAGTVYTATASDPDAGDTKTWSISAGNDKNLFTIDSSTGAVKFNTAPNYESPTDKGSDNTYDIVIKVADKAGLNVTQAVAITVTNVDEVQPTITSGTTATAIKENSGAGQVIYTATATDSGDTSAGVTFSLDPSADYKAFSIDGSTGKVTLTADPNFEGQSSYTFTVAASDGVTTPVTKTVTLAITNVDEHAPTITSGATANINENVGTGKAVYTATSTDVTDYVSGNTTYSLKTGLGDDLASFSINASTGVVTLADDPDAETKASYSFTVVATDAAGNVTPQAVVLSVNDLDEATPSITSGATATAINENSGAGQVVYTVTSDDSGDVTSGMTYSIKAATGDGASFTINGSSGAVTLTGNPDYETKSSYSFTVVATDGAGHSAEQAVSLAINNVSESPTKITFTSSSVNENVAGGTTVASLGTDDNDGGDSWTYTLVAGAGDTDNGAFSITGDSLVITGSPNYEGQSSYSIYVQVKDSTGNTFATQKTITVNNKDESAPVMNATDTASVNENVAGGTTVFTASSDDSKDYVSGSTTYSLKAVDQYTSFDINASTGVVTIKASPDYETKTSYSFTVIAKDAAGNTSEDVVTLNINDINEAPVINTAASISAAGVTFKVTDPEAATMSYSTPSGTVGTINNGASTTLGGAQTSLKEGTLKITDGTNVVDLSVFVSLGTTGNDTQTGSATATTGMWGYGGNDAMTAGNAGAKMIGGAGDDTLTGGSGVDTFYFSYDSAIPTGSNNLAANGNDVIKSFTAGSGGDVIAFPSAYVSSGIEDNGTVAGSSPFNAGAVANFATNSNKTTDIAGHVALYSAGASSKIVDVDSAADVYTKVFQSGNDITVANSSHAVLMAGAAGSTSVYVYYIDTDTTTGVTAAEITLVGTMTLGTGLDITMFDASNFTFYT